ncbi:LLM class flavin-dependent oxidoreductase [Lysinibacter sp. HNR]|uniref:LLM class flavin-dependent oxidoreductase n=1 Tax=Lysinibacter sp. HNR TaxID=3031408 RepID=UPI00243550C8|nr:LLM class flavin-dependent oxidoreductase [Lysinibacter sp. HNR]WGD37384.1 LLM class flavin-dependent oxidoreductase [Lysinibacter sp. HNR]
MNKKLELGIDTFGDVTNDAEGKPLSHAQVIRNVVAEGILAEEVGLDFFGVGEHHRVDFAVSSPEMILAAIASRTKNIQLGSAVTILSSDDPIRVFQRFATLDGISSGRAEVILGRGSFTESFPLFGLSLSDYEQLFEEKFDLYLAVREQKPVTWEGSFTPTIHEQDVYPHVENAPLRTWIGVGGNPGSVIRAAKNGLPLMFAIIGGAPSRFGSLTQLYRSALDKFSQDVTLPIGMHSPGFIAETDEAAREIFWPAYEKLMTRIGQERGWAPMTRIHYEQEIAGGALFVGSPETVARKIARAATDLDLSRFDLKIGNGPLSHENIMSSIELYGTEVAPRVREMLG